MDSPETELQTLFAAYETLGNEQAEFEKQVSEVKVRKRAVAKEIFDRFGRGPHEMGGDKYVITARVVNGATQYGFAKTNKTKTAV